MAWGFPTRMHMSYLHGVRIHVYIFHSNLAFNQTLLDPTYAHVSLELGLPSFNVAFLSSSAHPSDSTFE